MMAYLGEPLHEFIARTKRASAPVPAAPPPPARTGLPAKPRATQPDQGAPLMTTRKQELLHAAQEASQNYAHAKKQLADARALNAMGIRDGNVLFAESREHVCYHTWIRCLEAFNACS